MYAIRSYYAAVDQVALRAELFDQGGLLVVLILDLADDLLDDVLEGDDPLDPAVLVDHHGQMQMP